jgi:hypothetical protein
MTREQLIEIEADLASARSALAEAFSQLQDANRAHFVHPSVAPLIREPIDRCRLHLDENIRRVQRALNTTPSTAESAK